MFVIPVKYNGENHIVECLKSIRESGHDDLVVVVDSNSSDKSYFDLIKPFDVKIEDVGNVNYADGALWHCYHKYQNEDFVYSIHDSMRINENINWMKEKDCTALCYFDIQYQGPDGAGGRNCYGYCVDILMSLGFYPTEEEMHSFPGLFGSVIFCKRHILDKVHKLGFFKVLPKDKFEACSQERLWGFFLDKIGVNIKENNLLGDFIDSGKSKAITKLIVRRQ